MAITRRGNSVTGLVGNVILYEMNGKLAMRTRSTVKRKTESARLVRAQSNFSVVTALIRQFIEFTRTGFELAATTRNSYAEAMSVNCHHYNDALREGEVEDLQWLQLSKGRLSGVSTLEAAMTTSTQLTVTWQGTQPDLDFSDDDKAMVAVTSGKGAYTHINMNAGKRSAGSYTVELPPEAAAHDLHLFLSFIKPRWGKDKAVVSNSQYYFLQR